MKFEKIIFQCTENIDANNAALLCPPAACVTVIITVKYSWTHTWSRCTNIRIYHEHTINPKRTMRSEQNTSLLLFVLFWSWTVPSALTWCLFRPGICSEWSSQLNSKDKSKQTKNTPHPNKTMTKTTPSPPPKLWQENTASANSTRFLF